MRKILIQTALTVLLAVPAIAQTSKPVVELYTSQGCSSCPPADRLLAQLAEADDVIALALHVDYWDYIGWVDDLADPAYSARQRGYAKAAHAKHIFTPQMVIDGRTMLVGSDSLALAQGLALSADTDPVTLSARRTGPDLRLSAHGTGPLPDRVTVHIVRYAPELVRDITRGENAGKTVVYRNVVTEWTRVEDWITAAPLDRSVPLAGDSPVVILVQDGTSGPILAAVELP